MTLRELFEFVTDPAITDNKIDEHLELIQKRAVDRPDQT
jgi:hypothetical protein